MDSQVDGQVQNAAPAFEVDPWEAAFAALEHKNEESPAELANTGNAQTNDANASQTSGQEIPSSDDTGDSTANAGEPGELGDNFGASGSESAGDDRGIFVSLGEQELQSYRDNLKERIRNQAINEVAKEFVKRGVRNTKGVLGATPDDPDICKRDEDGVPHYFNPETGREFSSDDPRGQAQKWCDNYNKDMARVFNDACQKYEDHLTESATPRLKVLEFAPKYEKLDDIRRGMFENVIQDFEIKDKDGKVIGYSCDLDKALALVDRQVAMIQNYAKQRKQAQPTTPTGPALDMKTSNGAVFGGDRTQPKSLEEAMEFYQNRELEKIKNR